MPDPKQSSCQEGIFGQSVFWCPYNVLLHFPMLHDVQNEIQVDATLAPLGKNFYGQFFKMAARSANFQPNGHSIFQLADEFIMISLKNELRMS